MKKKLSISQKIRYARTEASLSQKELANQLQLSDKTVSAYEVGRAQPGIEVLRDIGQATGRPVTYFIDEEGAEEIDFAVKIRKIEQELAEIKQALKEKGYRV
ncbi:helix-turn-helix domain-containing protein [Patescibacteria group bacterium]|nr:helix-turn-helix domain-containing protein [Patescibacteria group bacterium]MBU1967283.1 helix-turn-helix domain-containing protein [Patescibacteria group bacterium]MBU2543791.1 helix-turn-helix domain-containing protein [Patescibacteria group bacterium]